MATPSRSLPAPSPGRLWPGIHGGRGGGEDPGLDWPHPLEACQHHHQAGSGLGSTGEEEEGKTGLEAGLATPSRSLPAPSPGRLWPGIHGGRGGGEDPGLDWPHPLEACQHHHQAGSGLGSTGEEEEGKTQGWIGHTLSKPASTITRQALAWDPRGKRRRGRPRNTWRRDSEAEMQRSWKDIGITGSECRRWLVLLMRNKA